VAALAPGVENVGRRFLLEGPLDTDVLWVGGPGPYPPAEVAALSGDALQGLVVVSVIVVLYLLVRSLRLGNPFTSRNRRLVLAAAVSVGVGGEAAALLESLGAWLVTREADLGPYLQWQFDVSLTPLGVGFLIAVASRLFAEGSALKAEVEATV
jgi:hypothetical protein